MIGKILMDRTSAKIFENFLEKRHIILAWVPTPGRLRQPPLYPRKFPGKNGALRGISKNLNRNSDRNAPENFRSVPGHQEGAYTPDKSGGASGGQKLIKNNPGHSVRGEFCPGATYFI